MSDQQEVTMERPQAKAKTKGRLEQTRSPWGRCSACCGCKCEECKHTNAGECCSMGCGVPGNKVPHGTLGR